MSKEKFCRTLSPLQGCSPVTVEDEAEAVGPRRVGGLKGLDSVFEDLVE